MYFIFNEDSYKAMNKSNKKLFFDDILNFFKFSYYKGFEILIEKLKLEKGIIV